MFDNTPNSLDSAFIQRDQSNQYYSQINISGSNLLIYHDVSGSLTADNINVWATNYGIGVNPLSASWASASISSSVTITASYASSASYTPYSDFAAVSLSASYSTTSSFGITASYAISAAGGYSISASWASQSLSSSYSLTASYAVSAGTTPTNVTLRGFAYNNWQSTGSINMPFAQHSSSGDFALLFVGSSVPINAPSGWSTTWLSNTSSACGAIFNKTLTPTDITNGFVTVTFTGTSAGSYGMFEFVGATAGIRSIAVYATSNTPNSIVVFPSLNNDILTTDSVCYYVFNDRFISGPGFMGISRGDIVGGYDNGLGAASFERFPPTTVTTSISPMISISSPANGLFIGAATIKSV